VRVFAYFWLLVHVSVWSFDRLLAYWHASSCVVAQVETQPCHPADGSGQELPISQWYFWEKSEMLLNVSVLVQPQWLDPCNAYSNRWKDTGTR
jgi:hypothetical protein